MELDGNVRNDSDKIGLKVGEQYPDEDEEDGEAKGGVNTACGGGGGGGRSENTSVGLRTWQNSSRVCRVSRASGGKDRHSKVYTAKGLRDRRVRLSVSTAIQFYDLQDRLGYDQPSKAVEWLINAAADSIAELPSLNCSFPETPKQLSDEKRPSASEPRFDPTEIELEIEPTPTYQQQQQQHHQHQHISATKSGCSSTSETSKSSVLSLSRNENRVKARERARERAAKEKEEQSHGAAHQQQDVNQNSQTSFTDLLTDGGIGANDNGNGAQQTPNFGLKSARPLPSTQMDYFNAGLVGPNSSRIHLSSGFSSQTHFGNPPPPPPFNVTGEQHQELQQFSFLPDHFMPAAGSDYNLNFTISSGLAGFNRGTLQSNSPSPLPHHLQRFSSVDAPNLPFFVGPSASSAPTVENHQFPSGFDARLQLCFGDGYRRSDPKGKGKS